MKIVKDKIFCRLIFVLSDSMLHAMESDKLGL